MLSPVSAFHIGHTDDLLAFEPPVLAFDAMDLGEHPVGYPFHAFVWGLRATVQLRDDIHHAVRIDRCPLAGKWMIVPPVEAAIDRPAVRDLERLDDVCPLSVEIMLRPIGELLEELPFVYVPRPV